MLRDAQTTSRTLEVLWWCFSPLRWNPQSIRPFFVIFKNSLKSYSSIIPLSNSSHLQLSACILRISAWKLDVCSLFPASSSSSPWTSWWQSLFLAYFPSLVSLSRWAPQMSCKRVCMSYSSKTTGNLHIYLAIALFPIFLISIFGPITSRQHVYVISVFQNFILRAHNNSRKVSCTL